jgi:Ca-activated chloride channel family protein
VSANALHKCILILLVSVFVRTARADSAREATQQGNRLFGDSKYTEAVSKYDEALVEQPQAPEPKFNKANSYYRMDDLGKAMDLYQEVAAGSKDMSLVARAKYNLANCFFQRGSKQRDSDLQKAVDDMKTSITYWRQVLDIDPKNEKAAKNIEVARLTIKDIMDQIKKQQEQQKQQQNKQDQQKQQQQQQQQGQQNQAQPQSQKKDPNQPQDPNQAQKAAQPKDPNQAKDQQQKEQQGQEQKDQQKQQMAPDATAQEILDREQQQKKDRDVLQRAQYQQVDKDW